MRRSIDFNSKTYFDPLAHSIQKRHSLLLYFNILPASRSLELLAESLGRRFEITQVMSAYHSRIPSALARFEESLDLL